MRGKRNQWYVLEKSTEALPTRVKFFLVFLSNSDILAILPSLSEILTAHYSSNRNMLKFDKEITKVKMLKYVIMNGSCEFLVKQ